MKKILLISLPATGKTSFRKRANKGFDRFDRPVLDLDYRGRCFKCTDAYRDASTVLINESFKQGCKVVCAHPGMINPRYLSDDVEIYYVFPSIDKMAQCVRDAFERSKKDDDFMFAKDYAKNCRRWLHNMFYEVVSCRWIHENTKIICLSNDIYINNLIDLNTYDLSYYAQCSTIDLWLNGYTVNVDMLPDSYVTRDHDAFDEWHDAMLWIKDKINSLYYDITEVDYLKHIAVYNIVRQNINEIESQGNFHRPLTRYDYDKLEKIVEDYMSKCSISDGYTIKPLTDR